MEILMKSLNAMMAAAVIAGAATLPLTANAWWGGGPWNQTGSPDNAETLEKTVDPDARTRQTTPPLSEGDYERQIRSTIRSPGTVETAPLHRDPDLPKR